MDSRYRERFARTIGIMTEAELEQVRTTPVGVAGLGMGGSSFINLVRLGFEDLRIADPDVYERTNINRQRAARESTIGVRKDEALVAEAQDINPAVRVTSFADGIQADNVDDFLEGLSWVVDTIDVFAMDCKLLLNERAREHGVGVVSTATLGHGAVAMVFDADTPSFAELSGIEPGAAVGEALQGFVRLLMPEVPEYMREQAERAMRGEGHIPFVVTGVEVAAVIVGVQILGNLLGTGTCPKAPTGIYCDPTSLRLETYTSPAVVAPTA